MLKENCTYRRTTSVLDYSYFSGNFKTIKGRVFIKSLRLEVATFEGKSTRMSRCQAPNTPWRDVISKMNGAYKPVF